MVTATLAPVIRLSLETPTRESIPALSVHTGLSKGLEQKVAALVERLENKVLAPLLASEEIESDLAEILDLYVEFGNSLTDVLVSEFNVDQLQTWVLEAEEKLESLFDQHVLDLLGEKAAESLKHAVNIKGMVFEAARESRDVWGDDEMVAVMQQLMAHDLCTIAVAHHISTGTGRQNNAERLAFWSYGYADRAYLASGLADSNHGLGTPLKR